MLSSSSRFYSACYCYCWLLSVMEMMTTCFKRTNTRNHSTVRKNNKTFLCFVSQVHLSNACGVADKQTAFYLLVFRLSYHSTRCKCKLFSNAICNVKPSGEWKYKKCTFLERKNKIHEKNKESTKLLKFQEFSHLNFVQTFLLSLSLWSCSFSVFSSSFHSISFNCGKTSSCIVFAVRFLVSSA